MAAESGGELSQKHKIIRQMLLLLTTAWLARNLYDDKDEIVKDAFKPRARVEVDVCR